MRPSSTSVLALQYGIPNIRGDQFRPVHLTDPNRWGLLGKGAILMGTSYGNRTSPVLRGAWILENIIGTPPQLAAAGRAGASRRPSPVKKVQTVRERLEPHRDEPVLQCLPRRHGSAGLRARELRCRRRLARPDLDAGHGHRLQRQAGRTARRSTGRPDLRGPARAGPTSSCRP